MRTMYFFTRKANRVVCEERICTPKETRAYIRLLKDVYGHKNVIASGNKTCLMVEEFLNR